jgi:hypothetical protein
MNYLKSLFFNFLLVFFANHTLPGILVNDTTKLPHVGGDLLFSFSLGLLNSLISLFCKLVLRSATLLRLAAGAFVVNFVAYALLKFLPVGIQILSVEGYLLGATTVALGSFLLAWADTRGKNKKEDPIAPPPSQDPPVQP